MDEDVDKALKEITPEEYFVLPYSRKRQRAVTGGKVEYAPHITISTNDTNP